MNIFLCQLFLISCLFSFPIERIKPLSNHHQSKLEGIDQIYLINLDQRIEKFQRSKQQLDLFQLSFHKVSAVHGWSLTKQDWDSIGVVYNPYMLQARWCSQFDPLLKNQKSFHFLDPAMLGQSCFSAFTTPGSVGCFLSHLSVICDALKANYQSVLVLEDDFQIVQNPNSISMLLKKLNQIVGADGWDILFLDFDQKDAALYFETNDFLSALKGLDLAWFWRPDITLNPSQIFHRELVDPEFIKVGSRMRTHAYVVNRTGINKIVSFYSKNGHYVPYDHELALIPDLRLFSLTYDVIAFQETSSDTKGNLP